MIDKAVASVAAAVADIRDGVTIMLDITQNGLLVTDIVTGLPLRSSSGFLNLWD